MTCGCQLAGPWGFFGHNPLEEAAIVCGERTRTWSTPFCAWDILCRLLLADPTAINFFSGLFGTLLYRYLQYTGLLSIFGRVNNERFRSWAVSRDALRGRLGGVFWRRTLLRGLGGKGAHLQEPQQIGLAGSWEEKRRALGTAGGWQCHICGDVDRYGLIEAQTLAVQV